MIISTDQMAWNLARELIDTIEKIATPAQIKSCNIDSDKSQIKVTLATFESANKVIEALNNTSVQEHHITAISDIQSSSVVASPKPG